MKDVLSLSKNAQRLVRVGINTLAIALLCLLAVFLPLKGSTVTLIWTICVFVIMAVSLNITMGCLGQLALGHMGFMAVGAYVGTFFARIFFASGFVGSSKEPQFVVVFLLSVVVGAAAAGLVGFLIGMPALRLKGDYLAILTLGFGLIIKNLLDSIPFIGPSMLNADCNLSISKLIQGKYLPLILLVTAVSIALMYTFCVSRFGRAMMSIRDNEIAAAACGVNVSFYKTLGFTFSAAFAGVAGVLYAGMMGSLSTNNFAFASSSIYNSIFVVVMVVLGGLASLTGSIVAGAGLVVLNELITRIPQDIPVIGLLAQFPMLLYALALVLFVMFRPCGIFRNKEFSLYRLLFVYTPFCFGKLKGLFGGKRRKKGETK